MSLHQHFEQNEPDLATKALSEAIKHHRAGRLIEAEQLYRKVIEAVPWHYDAMHRLAILYVENERPEHAVPLLKDALRLQSKNPEILNSLGVVLQLTGSKQESVMCFRQALALNPAYADALKNLGKALRDQGNAGAALECFMKLIQLHPNNPDFYVDIGKCYYEMGDFQQAILCLEKALHKNPDHVDALSGLGAALWVTGRWADARTKIERALQLEPDNAEVIVNFGELLYQEGKIDEALECFNRALTILPQYDYAMWRKSFALLAKGEYREGWKLYVAYLGCRDTPRSNIFAPMKPWDGNPAPNKHLLIWCEQGLGDTIQFIRYVGLCKERVGKVSVFCQKPLVRLFQSLPFVDNVSDKCERGSFDEHVPIMNLPHIFDTVLETIPAVVPYLHIDPIIEAKWAMRFVDTADTLKIGLVWAGGSHEESIHGKITDIQRSIGLESMKPWLNLEGIKFYSLQKDKPAEQIKALGLADCLTNFMDEVTDFADTAAIIQNLDLVITVDTSVAHLAGALGKPVWIMSRYNADWRWLQNRPANPWYPTARIFGQPAVGDWNSVVTEIGRELANSNRRVRG